MPMVNGKEYPYTSEGKAAAKKAVATMMAKKRKGMTSKTPATPKGMTY